MREQQVEVFTEREEECIDLLTQTGMKRSVAIVLVYLANVPRSVSRDIERGTDLRQPEVSQAVKYLVGRHWVTRSFNHSQSKRKPVQYYSLEVPFGSIISEIKKEKLMEINHHLEIIGKLSKEHGAVPG